MGRYNLLTDKEKATILQMHADGCTMTAIRERTGRSPAVITKVIKGKKRGRKRRK